MTDAQREIPSEWETDRDDQFKQYKKGLVKSYDGTVYSDPDTNQVMRFETKVQHLRFLHYKTGRPMDELWNAYEE